MSTITILDAPSYLIVALVRCANPPCEHEWRIEPDAEGKTIVPSCPRCSYPKCIILRVEAKR